MNWLQSKALDLLMMAVPIGLLASLAYQALKKVIEKETALLDKTPASVHRIYFGLVASVLTAAFAALGVTIDCPADASCLNAVTPEKLELLLEALMATVVGLLAHAGKKRVKG